ncbi:MAG: T9SS type A sorting domain-containing protein [Flavobacteriales bacterium]|nr:T9SS type A sorting domain-containing protein [Flavobacteriales bacterium]
MRYMKRGLLIIAVFSAVFVTAQDTWITGDVPVNVKKNTMFYHGGDFNIKSDATAVVTNSGWVYIKSGQYKNNQGDAARFINTHTDDATNDYGQLITYTSLNTGKMSIEKTVPNQGGSTQTGFPFVANGGVNGQYRLSDWATDTGIDITGKTPCGVGVFCTGRKNHPIFVWSNNNLRWDPVGASDPLNASFYYVVSSYGASPANATNYFGQKKTFTGVPMNTANSIFTPNTSSIDFGTNGVNVNVYSIRYYTYIDDYIDTGWANPNFGRYQVQTSNPGQSNLDLSYMGIAESGALSDGLAISGLKGVWSYTTSRVPGGTYSADTGVVKKMAETNASGEFVTGDFSTLIVRPFGAYVVKGNSSMLNQQITQTLGMKTFKNTPKVTEYGASGPAGTYTVWSEGGSAVPTTQQIELVLEDANGETGNKNYVAVSESFESGNANDTMNDWTTEVGGFYGVPESLSGGINEAQVAEGRKFYINKIAPNFVGKAIPLGFVAKGDTENLKLKVNLYDNGRKLKPSEINFADANVRFIFHDKQLGVYKDVTTDFEYEFTQTTNTENRFELFFGDVEQLSTDGIETSASSTVVYKNPTDTEYYVRFANEWNNATVTVHSLSGQLISSESSIDTSDDYHLSVPNGVYIVTAQDESGEKTVEKIVK